MFRDERYVAVPRMAKSDECSGMNGMSRCQGWQGATNVHGRTDICSSAIARLCLLSRSTAYIHVSVLHCSNKLHPCNNAISALPPSVVVVCRGAREDGAVIGCLFVYC